MAYIPRSSLIPNETASAIPVQMKKRRTIHAFGLAATLIFLLSLFCAVGIFLYKGVLEKRLEDAKQSLGAVSDGGNQKKIDEIRLYNDRLRVARSLLDNHVATSRIFEEIENSTKKSVQYRSLEFVNDPGFEATLTLTGDTKEFSSIALQKMQILEDSLFSDFVLQDITTSKTAKAQGETATAPQAGISFKVVGVFKKDLISYGDDVPASEPAPQETAPSSAPEDVAPAVEADTSSEPATAPADASTTPVDAPETPDSQTQS
ncbi:MAG TPA: hypothetical protein VFS75_01165 [Candidatus Paceibacterota bacterium]|nr:hypothetical protein [Candidatus Paceibacterota bacterium]